MRRLFKRTPKLPAVSGDTDIPGNPVIPVHSAPPAIAPPDYCTSPPTTSYISDAGETLLRKALEALPNSEDRKFIQKVSAQGQDINALVDASYKAACQQKRKCETERWTWTLGNKTIILLNEAEKLIGFLDKVKFVGSIVANVDPIHIGLPWTAMADSTQMGSLMTGMSLAFYMSGRLKVYFDFFQHLSSSKATDLLESSLVNLYACILAFFAEAIRIYQESTGRRVIQAMWQPSNIENFASRCKDLADRVEVDASGCCRELNILGREDDARRWKQSQDSALQSLDAIKGISNDIAALQEKFDLSKLQIAVRAIHSTHQANSSGCLKGTRTELIRRITEWADDLNGKPIFWLCGKAGTGKSAISVTVADHFKSQNRLGASFLFKRSENDRNDAQVFFTTIAKQLVDVIPIVGRGMAAALNIDSNLCNTNPKNQFEKLILNPLLDLSQDRFPLTGVVIVIDALDECTSREDVKLILHLLKQLATLTPLRLRLFVTSRPEVEFVFRDIYEDNEPVLHYDVYLETVQSKTIKADLRTYFLDCFAKMKAERLERRPSRPLPADWPSTEEIDALVDLADPLFIYASTVYLYLWKSRTATPQSRLEVLLKSRKSARLGDPTDVYLPILDRMAFEHYDGEDVAIKQFKEIVGPMIILADPLSINALAGLLAIDVDDVAVTLGPLYSVLDLPADLDTERDVVIRPLHLSFQDFLVDDTIKDNRFWIDEAKTHGRLATQCLQRLSQPDVLMYDICSVQKPATRRSSLNCDQINDRIPADVAYACCHWVSHAVQSKHQVAKDEILGFLKQHFLHWVEAISWLGRTANVITGLKALEMLATEDNGGELQAFLQDAERFMLRNRYIVDIAPLQLYSSALIFAPTRSIVRQNFHQRHCHRWPHSSPKVPEAWSAEIQKLEGHGAVVRAVAFSPNQQTQTLASASDDGILKLWNATTGELLHTLKGHEEPINAIAFSPNEGQVLASASNDSTIRLWNTTTGKLMQKLESIHDGFEVDAIAFSPDGKSLASTSGERIVRQFWDLLSGEITSEAFVTPDAHESRINSIAFSPSGKLLATASIDESIRLWDTTTTKAMQITHILSGHENWVRDLAFSPDGQTLASASDDGTVRLWSMNVDSPMMGKVLHVFDDQQTCLRGVAFSPNGQSIASASIDRKIRIWTTTGDLKNTLRGHDGGVNSVRFLTNGHLASVSGDRTVRIWDTATGEVHHHMHGHNDAVLAVALSPNRQVLASISAPHDKNVQLWNVSTGESIRTLEGHKNLINAVNFSPDGKVLASASYDFTVRLWNTVTGEGIQTLKGHDDSVNAVTFSPDGIVLASGSFDGTIRLWNASTGEMIHVLKGHDGWINALTFSPDGKTLASASDDQMVLVWNTSTGKVIHKLEGHRLWTRGVMFSPDGQILASTSDDKTVRLWNTVSGEEIGQIITTRAVRQMLFAKDNKSLTTDLGRFDLETLLHPRPVDELTPLMPFDSLPTLFLDGHWLRYLGDEYLWLPHEYRGTCANTIHGDVVAIGQSSGTVSFFRINKS
ncbi:vegetative incompatibility protein het-e-1 [Acrodontium crateriforme]|uniref:Vegetative incompatibility protein het-e-1 n=1 Tax=Acrodontium crateriforme TaxID=150365 RepID=A0AAQ3LZQ2_9PEZI|nr:vegetative incompatibility protein het-e-1 [Acrodontium crateriforme]